MNLRLSREDTRKNKEERTPLIRFKTVRSRLSATYFFVIAFCLIAVMLFTTFTVRPNEIDSCKQNLTESAESISKLLDEYSFNIDDSLKKNLEQIARYDNTQILIVDSYGIVRFEYTGSADLASNEQKLLAVRSDMLSEALAGRTVYNVGYDNDIYGTPVVSVCMPYSSGGNNIAGILVHTKMTRFKQMMSYFYVQILLSGVISALLAFLLVMHSSYKISKPLRKINLAARELARGNFEKHLDIQDENEIGQLADTFNMMANELQKYEYTRTSFVANVSHELKSPLTSIQGFVQAILDDTIEEADKKQYMEIVLAETKRLNTLIGDLLDLAKFESGQFPLNKTEWDINELIRQTLIKFITKIEDKSIEVVVNIPETHDIIYADKDRFAQVLTNLIDNAVKFCQPGGELKVWTHKLDGKINVSISNTGQTIPPEDLPFVFDRFFKVDKSHNRKAGGTGIGLSIVKNIIMQHGEDIWVTSKAETGTIFTFTVSPKDLELQNQRAAFKSRFDHKPKREREKEQQSRERSKAKHKYQAKKVKSSNIKESEAKQTETRSAVQEQKEREDAVQNIPEQNAEPEISLDTAPLNIKDLPEVEMADLTIEPSDEKEGE